MELIFYSEYMKTIAIVKVNKKYTCFTIANKKSRIPNSAISDMIRTLKFQYIGEL